MVGTELAQNRVELSLPPLRVTVVVPTLEADDRLEECVRSLEAQSLRDIEIIVVDNSGQGLAGRRLNGRYRAICIENRKNLGFGAAVNQGFRRSKAKYVATLNDDAVASAGWLAALVSALETRPSTGMAASKVVLPDGKLDSAGMLIARDGSSKQRGHLESPADHTRSCEVLLPSGSAAMYRKEMIDQIGGFEEEFFLYCEDTDLGLRARRAGWNCVYVPEALVEHQYSHSGGRASAQKAWLVERNRLRLVARNFPATWLAASFFASVWRYLWHVLSMLSGKGKAAEFTESGEPAWRLAWFVIKAHANFAAEFPALLAQRKEIRRKSTITEGEFAGLLKRHLISLREVAAL